MSPSFQGIGRGTQGLDSPASRLARIPKSKDKKGKRGFMNSDFGLAGPRIAAGSTYFLEPGADRDRPLAGRCHRAAP